MAALVALAAAAAVLAPIGANPSAAQSSSSGDGVVVIANGWSPPDVGAAAPLAGRLDAAVLYASKDELGQPTIDALEELNPSRVLLMGGPAALTPAVQSQVRGVLTGAQVERFSGDDRIDTAAKAALSEPAVPAGRPVVIANGWSPPDVGAAAPLAASLGGSVLFANEKSLGAPTVAALRRLAPSQVIIVGGTAALSGDIESQIAAVVPDVLTERLGGVDRVDTAARGAALAPVELGEPVVLANGWDAADVGIAAPLAASLGGSVLFTQRNTLSDRTAEALADLSPSRIILIGGSERLARAVDAELERLHPGVPRLNIAGPERITTAALAALFGVQFSAQQERLEAAVATITRGETDCAAAPQVDVAGIDVVDPPADLNDSTAPLTVAEVVRIAGGCALVDYVALDGRTVAEVRDLLADRPDVFAVGEPLRGFATFHDDGAHFGYGADSGAHYNDGAHEQWHLPGNYMEKLWDGWDDSTPVVVAVIDSGFDVDHPDLVNRVVGGGLGRCHREFGGRDDTHGTHVAGIVAAERGNGYGVSGVAPDARVLPIRFVGCGLSPPQAVELALNRADVDVINMSFGAGFTEERTETCAGSGVETPRGPGQWRLESSRELVIRSQEFDLLADCDPFGQILNIADQLGVVSVAAAGNSGHCQRVYEEWIAARAKDPSAEISDAKWCRALDPTKDPIAKSETPYVFNLPAGYLSTIAVTNIDRRGNRADSSNQNSYNSVAAPGTDITSTFPVDPRFGADKAFGTVSGTSMASPFVAGVVAHMLNRYPEATPAQIRRALESTAADRGRPRRDDQYGHGIVRPNEAIYRLKELLGYNHVERINVTASVCAPDDDTPSCPDPRTLLNKKLEPVRGRVSTKFTVADIARQMRYITVSATYESDGRPGGLSYSLRDTRPTIAGHQLELSEDRQALQIYTPDWKGDRSHTPSVQVTFLRVRGEETETGPVTSPELASLRVWDRSCGPGLSSGPRTCPSGSEVAIAPGFDPDVRLYSATVSEGTQLVTIDRVAAAGFELGDASPPDADASTPGYQVRLGAPAAASEGRADKPGTSAAVGERFLEVVGSSWSGAVIIASAENFPDGLAAASLAGTLRAPILLTPRDRLDPAVAEFIRDNPVSEIVIMGGPAAISNAVQAELRRVSGITNVPRLWGADRYETAIEIAERVVRDAGDVGQLCGTSSRAVFIATGRNSADALAASPAAYAARTPVLLVDPKSNALHRGVADFIEDHGIDTAVILGGTSAVPARVHEQLSDLVSINRVSRVAGPDRFETAAQLARDITSRCYDYGVETIGLANGRGFADALAAGPLVAELNGVMLLTEPDDVPPATLDAMTQIGKEAQLTNITLALLAIGDIAEADNAVTKANNTSGQQLHGQPALGPAQSISAGLGHTCAIRTDSTVQCWGTNGGWWVQPNLWPGEFTAIATNAGGAHTCGLRSDRRIHCVGKNVSNQTDPPSGDFTGVAAGSRHSCGIRAGGTVECWGANNWDQLELPPGDYSAVAGEVRNTCGINVESEIACTRRTDPPSGQFAAIAGGGRYYFCGIKTDGAVQCWGPNGQGQSDPPGGQFTAIAAGGYHSCGIKTDGTVRCWGWNEQGQADPPTGQFAAIAAGWNHSCGIRTDGAIQCWGLNQYGQSDPPSGQFLTEGPGQPAVDTPPLTSKTETISVPSRATPTSTTLTVTVIDPTDPTIRTTYQLTVRSD